MKLMFWGLIFLFFDFNLNIGKTIVISILPAFVGYAMIYVGMGKVKECEVYAQARPWVMAGCIFAAVVWVLNGLGVGYYPLLSMVISIVGAVFQLIVTYRIVQGVQELEAVREYDMYGRSLMTAWKVLVIWIILTQVVLWLNVGALAVLTMLASFVFMIYYIFRFHKSRKAYEECCQWAEGNDGTSDYH